MTPAVTWPHQTTFPQTSVGEVLHGPLATLDVTRTGNGGGGHGSMTAHFDLYFPSTTADLTECRTFNQALGVAHQQAGQLLGDGIPEHGGGVFPAQAIVQTMQGTFLVGPVATGHRGVIAQTGIDGPLIDIAVRKIIARNPDSPNTEAIVGATRWFDLREQKPVSWSNPAFSRDRGRIAPH